MEPMKMNGSKDSIGNVSPRNGAAHVYSDQGKFTTESEVYIGEPEYKVEKL